MIKKYVLPLLFTCAIGGPLWSQFALQSKDSTSTMRIKVGFQPQFEWYAPNDGQAIRRISIERARLSFSGRVFTPGLRYAIQLGEEPKQRDLGPNDPNKTLLDIWAEYAFSPHFGMRIGQYKVYGLRQGATSILNQQFTARSILARYFGYDRDIGLLMYWKYDIGGILVKPKFQYMTGDGRTYTGIFANSGNQVIFKLEILTGGEFATKEGYSEADLDREGHPKGSFSAGYEINRNPIRTRGNTGSYLFDPDGLPLDNRITSWFFDGIVKYKGASVLFEYIHREADLEDFTTGDALNVQAGFLFRSNYELALRYTQVDLNGSADPIREKRLVVNRYLRGHNLKFQAEIESLQMNGTDEELSFRLMLSMII